MLSLSNLKSQISNLTLLLIFLSAFFYFLNPSTDADLGWHLRYGQHFAQTGQILKDNTFSTQMPDYQWPNHSWGYDVVVYQLFTRFGFIGLSLIAAAAIASSLTLVLNLKPKSSAIPLAIFLFFGNHLLNLGARSQLASLFFTALLWHILLRLSRLSKTTSKKSVQSSFSFFGFSASNFVLLLIIPAIFLFWSNLHGQYILGLAIYGIFLLTHKNLNPKSQIPNPKSESKRIKLSTKTLNLAPKTLNLTPKTLLFASFILSCIASLLNPFGTNLIQTALSHFNSQAFPYIMEWMPWEWGTPRMYALIGYTLVLIISLYQLKKTQPAHFNSVTLQPFTLITLGLMALLAFKSRRIITYYLLLSLPTTATLIEYYQEKYITPHLKSLLSRIPHFSIFSPYFLSLITYLILLVSSTYHVARTWPLVSNQSWTTYCNGSVLCSEPLVQFMRDNQIRGKIFNDYRLGGWLIFRYPEEKVYVDGRMTLWEEETGISPFLRYLNIVHTQPGSYDVFRAENFDYVIVHHPFNLHQALAQTLKWPALYTDEKLTLFQNPLATLSATPKRLVEFDQ